MNSKTFKITEEMVKLWCEMFDDDNPIHSIENPISPGVLVTALVTNKPRPNWALAELNTRYHNPVWVGETVTLTWSTPVDRSKITKFDIQISVGSRLCQTIKMTIIRLDTVPDSPANPNSK
jgi:acyl dehydratase